MAKEPTAVDRDRFKAARARGEARAQDASALVDAHYDRKSDAVFLIFRGGGSMTIPRHAIPGLERQPASVLEAMILSPAGDALLWPAIDADVYVPGLVERAFGNRLFAAAAGRRGGQRKTKAKMAAARRNGARGGRPRRRATA
ncbi:MAG TPA: DUF2442 domain-containing protein [Vicinamibacterales bacterium]|nr:DUF2442 domain-containing protein [Vicinamibacterales bacterium]